VPFHFVDRSLANRVGNPKTKKAIPLAGEMAFSHCNSQLERFDAHIGALIAFRMGYACGIFGDCCRRRG
jgi:hypothetical protein